MHNGTLVSESKDLRKWLETKYGRAEANRILTFGPFARGKKTSALRRFARHRGNETRLLLAEQEIKELVDRELRLAEIALALSNEAKSAPSAKERERLLSIEKDAEAAMLRIQDYRTRLMVDAAELRNRLSEDMARALAARPLPKIEVHLDPLPDDWEEKRHMYLQSARPREGDPESIASLDLMYASTARLRQQFKLELLGYDFTEHEAWLKLGNQFGCLKLNARRGKKRLSTELLCFGRAAHDGAELLEWVGNWREPLALTDFTGNPFTKARIARVSAIPKNLRTHQDKEAFSKGVEETCALIGELASRAFQARESMSVSASLS